LNVEELTDEELLLEFERSINQWYSVFTVEETCQINNYCEELKLEILRRMKRLG
jgi:hypothetical protein